MIYNEISKTIFKWLFENKITKNNMFFIACHFGTYGEGCNQTCGRCLGNVTCNNVNGTCGNGCEEGYMGSRCNTRMLTISMNLFENVLQKMYTMMIYLRFVLIRDLLYNSKKVLFRFTFHHVLVIT